MGISTLQSYCGAQVFEAVGLDRAIVDRYFTRTASRIGGISIDVVAEEVRRRHEQAFPTRPVAEHELEWGGEYQWRRDGEYHLFNPETVFKLQHATRSGQYAIFKAHKPSTTRTRTRRPWRAPRAEASPGHPDRRVEPVESIVASRPARCRMVDQPKRTRRWRLR
jgi:glutamate synthase domain-containing protein 2